MQRGSDGPGQAPLRCVAFTDHNSVEGFRKYKALYSETFALASSLRARDSKNALLEQLDDELKIWRSIRVLMGMEIKADPGIDLLVILHESVDMDPAVEFLQKAYNREYIEIKGDPTPTTGRTIIDTLNLVGECFAEKAMVVGPHADSSGGVYEGLKDYGQARAAALRHPVLRALSFNRADTRDRIRGLFSQPEYRRPDQVALIQTSDFHGQHGVSVGRPRTDVLVPGGKASFTNLRDAFGHPDRVKCSIDFVEREYRQLIEGKHLVSFTPAPGGGLFRAEDLTGVAQSVCAILNTGLGIVQIEVSIPSNADRDSYVKPLVAQLKERVFVAIDPPPVYVIPWDFRLSPGKVRILFIFPPEAKLHTLDGAVWVVKDAETRRATALEIEHVVSKSVDWRFGKRSRETLEKVSWDCTLLAQMPQGIPLVLGCQQKLSFGLPTGIQITDASKTGGADWAAREEIIEFRQKVAEEFPFGSSRGEVSLIVGTEPPRERDHYLRFTAFRCEMDPAIAEKWGGVKIERRALTVVPGGASI